MVGAGSGGDDGAAEISISGEGGNGVVVAEEQARRRGAMKYGKMRCTALSRLTEKKSGRHLFLDWLNGCQDGGSWRGIA